MNNENQESITKRNKLCYIIIGFIQGISTLSDLAIIYFLKDQIGLQPYQTSRVFAFINLAGVLKPFLGLITDLFPILGYRRKVYLMICGFLGFICWIMMAIWADSVAMIVFCLFTINLSMCFSSAIGEGIVVELSNSNPTEIENRIESKNNVSSFFLLKNGGILVSSFFKGYLIEIMPVRNIFIICSILPLFNLLSGIILIEPKISLKNISKKQEPSEDRSINETLLNKQSTKHEPSEDRSNNETLINKNIANKDEKNIKSIKEFWEFIKKKELYIPTFFAILLFCGPGYGDPFFFFLTNYLLFTPLELGMISFISSLGVFLALFSYRFYLKEFSFKCLTISTKIFFFLFTFLLYLLVIRVNLIIGIPDFLFSTISYFLIATSGELNVIPLLGIACSICPKKLEATIYTLFMASINLGITFGAIVSSFLSVALGISANNFNHLGVLLMISNFYNLIPCLALIYLDTKYFEPKIPHKNQIDIKDENEYEEIVNHD